MAQDREQGFTLVELLVVMLILGILASVAAPAFLTQRRKAHEASAKTDVKTIVKEVQAFYVDGAGPLQVTGSAGTWTLAQGGFPLVSGALRPGNDITASSHVTSDVDFCIAVVNPRVGAMSWTGDSEGLRSGDC